MPDERLVRLADQRIAEVLCRKPSDVLWRKMAEVTCWKDRLAAFLKAIPQLGRSAQGRGRQAIRHLWSHSRRRICRTDRLRGDSIRVVARRDRARSVQKPHSIRGSCKVLENARILASIVRIFCDQAVRRRLSRFNVRRLKCVLLRVGFRRIRFESGFQNIADARRRYHL